MIARLASIDFAPASSRPRPVQRGSRACKKGLIRGSLWGFVAGTILATRITLMAIYGDSSVLSEGKVAVTCIVLMILFAFPGTVLGAIIGLFVALLMRSRAAGENDGSSR